MNKTNWDALALEPWRQVSDEAGDRLIQNLYDNLRPAEIGRLYQRYLNGLDEVALGDMPAALREYFESNQHLPGWANEHKIRLAESLFLRVGPEYAIALLFRALPVGYVAANTVKVLTSTGYLSSDLKTGTAKRLLETTQFILDVMPRGALQPGARGIKSILKVRFIHSMVRYHLLRHGWDSATHGVPVNQEDMAGTILTFSVAAIMGMDRLQIRLSEEERDALVHFWSAVGYVIGVDESLLPQDYAAGKALYETILEHQARPSEDGRRLTAALGGFIGAVLDLKSLPKVQEYIIRYLIGVDRYSDMLGLATPGNAAERLGFESVLATVRTLNRFRGNALADGLAKPLNRYLSTRILDYFSQEFDMQLHFPEEIRRHWGVLDRDDLAALRGYPLLRSLAAQGRNALSFR